MTMIPNSETAASDACSARPQAQSSNAPVIDLTALVDRCMGNLEFAERILDRFQERAEQDLEELEKLIELRDAGQLARVAHRMKGSSANVAAEGLQRIAEQIEELGRSGRLAEVPAHLEQFRREWARCQEFTERIFLQPDTI
jgi:HPt (histidine-containing phosphotransfer) domain-containing protein